MGRASRRPAALCGLHRDLWECLHGGTSPFSAVAWAWPPRVAEQSCCSVLTSSASQSPLQALQLAAATFLAVFHHVLHILVQYTE
jgi:hypothetical protein